MKKNIYIAIFAGLTLSFASCNKFDYEDPTFDKSLYESDREATEANISIKEIKAKYKTAITNNSTSNKITTDAKAPSMLPSTTTVFGTPTLWAPM